jgi:hypothetical protein
MSSFTDEVVIRAEQEFDRFGKGKGRETIDPYCQYVGMYWSVGLKNAHIDGRTTYHDAKGKPFRPAWSAAFVSFIMRTSGAGSNFYYHEGHIHYVVKAIRDAQAGSPTIKFLGRDPKVYVPKVGDLINAGRGSAKKVTYKTVLKKYGDAEVPDGDFMPSHTDIIVAIDSKKRTASTIGGNVEVDTVGKKTWALDADGTLKKKAELICVIECTM